MPRLWPIWSARAIRLVTTVTNRLLRQTAHGEGFKRAFRVGYQILLRLAGSHDFFDNVQPSGSDVRVEPSPSIQRTYKEFDDETRAWAKTILEGDTLKSPYSSHDPEGVHDALRVRGILALLAELFKESRSALIQSCIENLLRRTADLTDRCPSAGWDPTTSALRLISLLRAAETLRKGQLELPGMNCWLRRFIEEHEAFLVLGRDVEPAGNHPALNAAGRVALHFLLQAGKPLSEKLAQEVADVFRCQFLPDGGHIERTPHYHYQTVELLGLLRRVEADQGGCLLQAKTKEVMLGALTALAGMLSPLGTPVRFGDSGRSFSGREPSYEIRGLVEGAFIPNFPNPTILVDFGLIAWRWEVKGAVCHLFADIGRTGLTSNPGHGHGDGLSYCLYVGEHEIVADPGTYLYADSPEACWFKLPEAHNVVYCPRHPSHRLSRFFRWRYVPPQPSLPAPPTHHGLAEAAQEWHFGSCKHRHSRSWLLTNGGLTVADRLDSSSAEPAFVRVNLHPDLKVRTPGRDHATVDWNGGRLHIRSQGSAEGLCLSRASWYAPSYGSKRDAVALEWPLCTSNRSRTLHLRHEVEV